MQRSTSSNLRRLAAGMIAVVALTGACGGGDDGDGGTEAAVGATGSGDGAAATVPADASAVARKDGEVPKACDVVDAAMVKEATGHDVTAGQTFAGQDIVCGFPGSGGDGSGVIVTLTGYGEAGFDSSTTGWPDPKDATGVGDEARYSEELTTFTARKGDLIVNISLEYLVATDRKAEVGTVGATLAKAIFAKV